MSAYASERARDRIAALAGNGLDLVSFWREATEIIEPVVPHYMGPCWYTLDPASLLITSHFNDYMPELPTESLALEYYEDDVNKLADVARSQTGVSTLHEATGGDPTGSPRWQANIQLGGDQELVAGLLTPSGDAWGGLGLYREAGAPMFIPRRSASCARSPPRLGRARAGRYCSARPRTRRSRRRRDCSSSHRSGRWSRPHRESSAGSPTSPRATWMRAGCPPAILAVAGRALRSAEGRDEPGEVALTRVLTRSGTWVVLHGATLVSDGTRRIAVILEPAHPARIAPLLMSAYGLSEREQDVTRLVLQGESTAAIADRLVVSAHTVQQHLKSIFEKTGVHSRRDLVGKVFFSPTTNRVCATTSRACRRTSPCVAGRWPSVESGEEKSLFPYWAGKRWQNGVTADESSGLPWRRGFE